MRVVVLDRTGVVVVEMSNVHCRGVQGLAFALECTFSKFWDIVRHAKLNELNRCKENYVAPKKPRHLETLVSGILWIVEADLKCRCRMPLKESQL